MCSTANFELDGNQVQVCQVGSLRPGDTYRTPDGATLMVLDLPAPAGDSMAYVTDCRGRVTAANNSLKLGRDRQGRLYASRSLNIPAPEAAPYEGIKGDAGDPHSDAL